MITRPYDEFIVPYPKCGTTWMQQIVNNGIENGIDIDVHMPFTDLISLEEVESLRRGSSKYQSQMQLCDLKSKKKQLSPLFFEESLPTKIPLSWKSVF